MSRALTYERTEDERQTHAGPNIDRLRIGYRWKTRIDA